MKSGHEGLVPGDGFLHENSYIVLTPPHLVEVHHVPRHSRPHQLVAHAPPLKIAIMLVLTSFFQRCAIHASTTAATIAGAHPDFIVPLASQMSQFLVPTSTTRNIGDAKIEFGAKRHTQDGPSDMMEQLLQAGW
jgi:hypothetical protein